MKKLSCFLLLVFAVVAIAVGETPEITSVGYFFNVSHLASVTNVLDDIGDDMIEFMSRDWIVSKIDKPSGPEITIALLAWSACNSSYSTEYGDIFYGIGRIGYRLYHVFIVFGEDHRSLSTKLYKVYF
jgi:hypothetical protein